MLLSAILRLLVVVAGLCLATVPAAAEWIVFDQPDPTTGGARTVLAGQASRGGEIQVLCRGERRTLNFLYPENVVMSEGEKVRLNLVTDNGQVWEAPATVYKTGAGFFALSYDNKQDLEGIVRDIVAAKTELAITITDGQGRFDVYSGNVKGSTAAGRTFLSKCFAGSGASPVVQTAEAAAPAAEGANWVYETYPGGAPNTPTASVTGSLGQGGFLVAYCLGGKTALVFFNKDAATFPYEDGDMGLQIHLEVDGTDLSSVGQYIKRADGVQGVLYAATGFSDAVLDRVGGAGSELVVRIQSYSNNITTRWSTRDLSGLSGAVASLRTDCLGIAAAPGVTVPAAAAPAPASGWSIETGADAIARGHKVELSVATSPAYGRFVIACSPGADVWTIGIVTYEPLAFELAPFRLALKSDDVEFVFDDAYFEPWGDDTSVVDEGKQSIVEFVSVLTLSPSRIAVSITDPDDFTTEFTLPIEGAADAATDTFSMCFGLRPVPPA